MAYMTASRLYTTRRRNESPHMYQQFNMSLFAAKFDVSSRLLSDLVSVRTSVAAAPRSSACDVVNKRLNAHPMPIRTQNPDATHLSRKSLTESRA